MKSIKSRELVRKLSGKGFCVDNKDHIYLKLVYNNKITSVYTKVSHGSKDIGQPILGKIKRQLRFEDNGQFWDFVNCSLSYEDYIRYLKSKGIIK